MNSPIAIPAEHLKALLEIAETFVDGAPDEDRIRDAIDCVRAELDGAGHGDEPEEI